MESLEPFGTPIAPELRASFSGRREASNTVYFSFFFLFVFVMFVYQAKIIQNCFYHKPLKNSTTALTPPASNHYSIFADSPLINHTNYCPLFPPALGSAPFPFLFPFLPQIRTLRQVANKLHGYIYSALATYFYAVIYLHHEDIDGHLLRLYNFECGHIYIRTSMVTCSDDILLKLAVVSAAAPLIIPSSAHAGKLYATITWSKF